MFRRTPPRPLRPTVGNTVGLTTRFSGSYPMNTPCTNVKSNQTVVVDLVQTLNPGPSKQVTVAVTTLVAYYFLYKYYEARISIRRLAGIFLPPGTLPLNHTPYTIHHTAYTILLSVQVLRGPYYFLYTILLSVHVLRLPQQVCQPLSRNHYLCRTKGLSVQVLRGSHQHSPPRRNLLASRFVNPRPNPIHHTPCTMHHAPNTMPHTP